MAKPRKKWEPSYRFGGNPASFSRTADEEIVRLRTELNTAMIELLALRRQVKGV